MNQFEKQSETILKQGLKMLTEKSELLVQANDMLKAEVEKLTKERDVLEVIIARLREQIRADRGEVE